ncbi:MAG: hypothetical protein AAFQ40_00150 [Cyanobacteria bacterium J06623_5]
MAAKKGNETQGNISNVSKDTLLAEDFIEEDVLAHRTFANVAYQFFLGAALGLVLSGIPLAISMPDLQRWNVLASVAVVLLSGLLSALFGKHFLSKLVGLLASFPPIA